MGVYNQGGQALPTAAPYRRRGIDREMEVLVIAKRPLSARRL